MKPHKATGYLPDTMRVCIRELWCVPYFADSGIGPPRLSADVPGRRAADAAAFPFLRLRPRADGQTPTATFM